MKTKRLLIDEKSYNESIDTAASILKSGGVVAIPTETVYGLAASAYDDNAIVKVFKAKGRPQDNPLIVHISNMEMLDNIALEIPEKALECAEKFWPGPLTMVLKKKDVVAQSVSAGLSSVAVRMPSNKVARDVISACKLPLAAPSANSSGSPSPTNPKHVLNDLDGKIDAVIMGDSCEVGVESTVITFVGEHPSLLRPGAVTLEQLREVLPDITVNKAVLSELEKGETAASPGMKYKHYSPKAQVFLVEGENFADFVNKQKESLSICFLEEESDIKTEKIVYGSKFSEGDLAKNIFSALRKVDELNAKTVYVHAPSKTGVGLAVYNRLIRAAAFKVIKL